MHCYISTNLLQVKLINSFYFPTKKKKQKNYFFYFSENGKRHEKLVFFCVDGEFNFACIEAVNLNEAPSHLPTTGSKTACVACSSPIGVLNQIRFNLFAMGESSVDATVKKSSLYISSACLSVIIEQLKVSIMILLGWCLGND